MYMYQIKRRPLNFFSPAKQVKREKRRGEKVSFLSLLPPSQPPFTRRPADGLESFGPKCCEFPPSTVGGRGWPPMSRLPHTIEIVMRYFMLARASNDWNWDFNVVVSSIPFPFPSNKCQQWMETWLCGTTYGEWVVISSS